MDEKATCSSSICGLADINVITGLPPISFLSVIYLSMVRFVWGMLMTFEFQMSGVNSTTSTNVPENISEMLNPLRASKLW